MSDKRFMLEQSDIDRINRRIAEFMGWSVEPDDGMYILYTPDDEFAEENALEEDAWQGIPNYTRDHAAADAAFREYMYNHGPADIGALSSFKQQAAIMLAWALYRLLESDECSNN